MKLNSKYTGIYWVVAATALACGGDEGATGTSIGNAGTASGGSPGASAGATSGSGQGTGGTGSGTNSEGQPNVSGGVDDNNGSNAGNSGGSAGSPAMLGNGGAPATPACTVSACPAVDVNADGAPEPGCCTMAGACGGEIAAMGTTFCAGAGGGAAPGMAPFGPEPIVTDPRCVEQTVNGITLPGCCDNSGVCGISTAPVASDAGGVPTACLTPADLAGFGVAGDAGAVADVSCQ